jgi:hypothetical protein
MKEIGCFQMKLTKQDIEIQCDWNKVKTHFHMEGMCLEIKGKHSEESQVHSHFGS